MRNQHHSRQQCVAVERGKAAVLAARLHENGSWLVTTDAVRLAVPLMLATWAAVRP
jgi:hypothetical protein